jgi:hypothetical protein
MQQKPIELKNDTITHDPRLDRIVQFDERSRNYPIRPLLETTDLRIRRWRGKIILDQGYEGACVGFSIAKELELTPVAQKNVTATLAKRLYCRAQEIDPWAGGACPGNNRPFYEGTSVLAGAKAAQEGGYIGEYRWAFGIDDVLATISNLGPVVLGVNWYSGMMNPEPGGVIRPTGSIVGGHAIVASGYHPNMQIPELGWKQRWEVVELTNSWGADWGKNGRCFIMVADLERLLREQGEAMVPVKRLRVRS